MSLSLEPESSIRPRGMDLLRARAAATVGLWLSMLPPYLIRQVMHQVLRRAAPATVGEAAVARAYVCAVSARCAGQGCLQRSLAVVLFCRLSGRAPGWRTGYRTEPFLAHAWVDVDGVPVGEPAEVAVYTPVLAVDPRRALGQRVNGGLR